MLGGQAQTAAAASQESVILIKLHTKLDIIMEKQRSLEARFEELERQVSAWSW